ncbi:Ulp1 family isopeptidase [Paraburkholderia sp. BR14320]|uniref:Ulp1 family isopeptidase n=1 Tax=unclassified Paraburkholderia TaxID=2615204 RepID=UPI0034CE1065
MDRNSWNPWDIERFSQAYAELLEQQVRQEQPPSHSRSGSPAHGSAQPAEVMQGLKDLQLERGSRASEPVVCRISYAKKTVIYNQEDKAFVESYIDSRRRRPGGWSLEVRVDALARLSNACPGFAGRLGDPELDEIARNIDSKGEVQWALEDARRFGNSRPCEQDQALIDFVANSTGPTNSTFAGTVRNFSAWLRRSGRPAINGRIDALDADVGTYAAATGTKGQNLIRILRVLQKEMGSSAPYKEDEALSEIFYDPPSPYKYSDETAYRYANGIRQFSSWLKKNKLPAINGRLGPKQSDALYEHLNRSSADLNKNLRSSKQALVALRRMGVGQGAPDQPAGSSQPFHTPDEVWPGWQEALGTFSNEQYDRAEAAQSPPGSSFFRGLSPWEGYNRPEESGSTFAGLSPLGYGVAYGSRAFDPDTPQSVVGPSHAADPEIVEVDSYRSPQGPISGVAQRLAGDPWLWDSDLVTYTEVLTQQLQGQPHAHLLSFVDPQQVRLLTEGNPQQQMSVLARIAGPDSPPILFLPVNVGNLHWSLLVVNRTSGQAFHYDSTVPPQRARRATGTAQFQQAAQVAAVLGARAPVGTPIVPQPDQDACGYHVLSGIETLARRFISGEALQRGGMDLSDIQPDRQHVISVLTQAERFRAEIARPQRPRQVPDGGDQSASGSYPDISHLVGDWQHGNQRASSMLVNMLENQGLMPSPYVPQTYMLIHGQRYMASLYGNEVWLTQTLNLG